MELGKYVAEEKKLIYHFQANVYWQKENNCFYFNIWHFAVLQMSSLKAGVSVFNQS